jgi:hypothetical protein
MGKTQNGRKPLPAISFKQLITRIYREFKKLSSPKKINDQ